MSRFYTSEVAYKCSKRHVIGSDWQMAIALSDVYLICLQYRSVHSAIRLQLGLPRSRDIDITWAPARIIVAVLSFPFLYKVIFGGAITLLASLVLWI